MKILVRFNVGLGLGCFLYCYFPWGIARQLCALPFCYCFVEVFGQVMNLNVLMGNLRLMFQLMLFHFGELMPHFV